ncbi:HmuY family protein [Olivibacter sitiensis]|uniref:HmuY family protein n=1 Tax=Olivibacter sitiensis TaxID=376470 RepID=UPI000406F077|nr:HmuY family protein [Olivibacter sitiensis]
MKKKSNFLLIVSFTLLGLQACKDDNDDYIPPVIKGSKVIAMGASYQNTVFFKLSTEKESSVPVSTWDLAFESQGGTAVRSNIARKGGVYATTSTDFSAVTTVPTSAIAYDDPSGDLSKTAVGAWQDNGTSKNLVYVLYRGNNPPSSATPIGYKKFQLLGYANGKYTIRHADLDGSNEKTDEITTNTDKNFTFFSFDEGIVEFEPDKKQWDIAFTCVTVRGGGPNSYVISPSVVSNRYSDVEVAVDNPGATLTASDDPAAPINTFESSNSNFSTIVLSQIGSYSFSNDAMSIGRDWHQILQPHASGIYKVYDWKTYIVKDTDGNYFKLKMTAFKNLTTGEVGYPSFEYEQLQ